MPRNFHFSRAAKNFVKNSCWVLVGLCVWAIRTCFVHLRISWPFWIFSFPKVNNTVQSRFFRKKVIQSPISRTRDFHFRNSQYVCYLHFARPMQHWRVLWYLICNWVIESCSIVKQWGLWLKALIRYVCKLSLCFLLELLCLSFNHLSLSL